jgi:hypothetical protein
MLGEATNPTLQRIARPAGERPKFKANKMKIIETKLPINSVLNTGFKTYDYVDSFSGEIATLNQKIEPIDVGKAFFSSAPKWVSQLMVLRNKIVRIFGLKTVGDVMNPEEQLRNFRCEPGEQLGLFKVFSKTENEVVLGEDDKHLNFRVSLYLEKSETAASKTGLTISTTVEFNNWFGRLYFLPVRPFHRLIVPSMLRGIIRELENKGSK